MEIPRRSAAESRLHPHASRRARLLVLAASGVLVALAATVVCSAVVSWAQDESATELTPEARSALDGGLAYLAAEQGAEGSTGEATAKSVRLASTSLSGLAFLAAGSTPSRGTYRDSVKGALDYVLRQANRENLPFIRFGNPPADQPGRMHAHGFAMLFLAEAYGTMGTESDLAKDVRATLEGAVKLSLASQTAKGGWGYAFAGEGNFAYGVDEASTTITQIQGLRAARNAGIKVPSKAIDRAVEYVKACMNASGECRYSLAMDAEGTRTSFELTAAAVSTLNASGAYDAESLATGLGYLRREVRRRERPTMAADKYYFYGNLYAAQAFFQAGGADWASWFQGAQVDLVSKAHRRGDEQVYWEDEQNFGRAYATASACLILEIPLRYLPIFER